MFDGLGAPELIIILVIVLLLFGSKKLPEMARSLGRSSKEFKKGMAEGAGSDSDDDDVVSTDKDSADQPAERPAEKMASS
jgi:sec-independent protein translocase protein TatA